MEIRPGDPVWVKGSTGKLLPGTLVGSTKTQAKVKLWKPSAWKYGKVQRYAWAKVTLADRDHIDAEVPTEPLSFI